MNIYLDIDGVLVTGRFTPALYVKEFLRCLLSRYPDSVYWLTAHCMDGDADEPIRDIGPLFDGETLGLLKQVKGTRWSIKKTEAIDFSKPFLWFDDYIFPNEEDDLAQHHARRNRIVIDLAKDPEQLKKIAENFEEYLPKK